MHRMHELFMKFPLNFNDENPQTCVTPKVSYHKSFGPYTYAHEYTRVKFCMCTQCKL